MKYILGPFFKYLWLSIKFILQVILAILLTIGWGIPTLIWSILYFIFVSIWEFKLCFYKLQTRKTQDYDIDNSITHLLLWAEQEYYNHSYQCNGKLYKSYFHKIWNLKSKTPIMVQIINKINNKLNLN